MARGERKDQRGMGSRSTKVSSGIEEEWLMRDMGTSAFAITAINLPFEIQYKGLKYCNKMRI